MPKHLLPRRNAPHRIAAIALYRALLSQSRNLPSASQEQRDAIQTIIRNRFSQAQHLESPRLLKVNFQAGYEAIDYLDAARAGDESSRTYILNLLQRSPARVKEPKPARLVSKKAYKRKRSESEVSILKDEHFSTKDERPRIIIFDRPLPLEKLSGKRHVPVLFTANHIPVLRLKKPQPASLSKFIRDRIEQRQAWHDRRHRLNAEVIIARYEDEWDQLTSRTEIEDGEEPLWEDAILDASADVDALLARETRRYQDTATKMQAVVDREQALYDEEKMERRGILKAKKTVSEQEWYVDDQNEAQYRAMMGAK